MKNTAAKKLALVVSLPAKALASAGRLALYASFVILFSLFTLTFASPVLAQAPPPCAQGTDAASSIDAVNKCAIDNSSFDDKLFNFNQIAGTIDSIQTLLTGTSYLHYKTNNATAGTGALASAGKTLALIYTVPPASGVQYFAQKIRQFNPVQEAYAANPGIGFTALTPVQNVWTAFRNISYIGFVLVFIVIGFMVMFRSKISPQAVATIQDSLPRIVVALILVTFSYAIVGLMIDAMFVILNVIVNALANAKGPDGITPLIDIQRANNVISSNVFSVIWGAKGDIFGAVFGAIDSLIEGLFQEGPLGKTFGFLGGTTIAIISAIAMLFIMFRVFIMLLMAYISIIVLTIFAPFILLFHALPGNNGAKEWFKQVAANISVFPVVALMFILAGMLSGVKALGGTASKFTGGEVGQFPLLTGSIDIKGGIGPLIGLGILFMTPTAAKIVKDKFGIKEGGGIGAGGAMAAATLGAGAGAIGKPIGAAIDPIKRSMTYGYGEKWAKRIGRFTGNTAQESSPTGRGRVEATEHK